MPNRQRQWGEESKRFCCFYCAALKSFKLMVAAR